MRNRTGSGWLALGAAVALVSCDHSSPTEGAAPPEQTGPLTVSAPTRLTFDEGVDHLAAFSEDGTSLFYTFQPRLPLPPIVASRPDPDICLAVMPAGGGTRRTFCRSDVAGLDSTDAFEHATPGPEGLLLYGAFSSRIGAPIPNGGTLRIGSSVAPLPGRALLTMPTVIGGVSFDHVGTIRWASASVFYVLATDQTTIGNPYNEIKIDTLTLGRGILRGDLTATGAVFSAVPGSDSASGFDLSRGRDSIYFTRVNDAALYVMPVAGGGRRTLFSEAALSPRVVLRDPVRIGARIAVVRQEYQSLDVLKWPDPPIGLRPGSRIELVLPADGSATSLVAASGDWHVQGALAAFGAMAASPDGCRLVVEHRIVQQFSFTSDLYAYCLGPAGQCACS